LHLDDATHGCREAVALGDDRLTGSHRGARPRASFGQWRCCEMPLRRNVRRFGDLTLRVRYTFRSAVSLSYRAQSPIDVQSIQRIEPISQLSGATRPCFLGCGPVSPSPHIRRRSAGTFRMDSLDRSTNIGRPKAASTKFRGSRLFWVGHELGGVYALDPFAAMR
jgi:hypothetical protein